MTPLSKGEVKWAYQLSRGEAVDKVYRIYCATCFELHSCSAEGGLQIRAYQPSDYREWLRMRRALWPDLGPDEAAEAADWLAQPDAVTFVAARPGGELAGFAEFGTRPWAEGCESGPVAYLEGWYVDPDARRTGVGAALVRAGEEWARQRGLRDLASDALIENATSHRAHLALGFDEVERVVLYRKALAGRSGDAEPGAAPDTGRG